MDARDERGHDGDEAIRSSSERAVGALFELLQLPMDAPDSSANVVEVEASGGHENKVVAAVRARSIDYEPIIDDTVAGLAPTTADERRKIYAQARSVVTRGLAPMGLPEAIMEVEEFALDVAIARVEERWRAKEAAEGLAAENSAAENAIHVDAGLSGGRAVRDSLPPCGGGMGWGVVPGGNEVPPPATPTPDPSPQGGGEAFAALSRRKPAPLQVTQFNVPPVIATTSIAASLLRDLPWPIGVAVALPVIAVMIFFVSHIDGKVIYRSVAGDRIGSSLFDSHGGPGVRARIAAGGVSGHRNPSPAAPLRAAFPSTREAPALAPSIPSPASGGKGGGGAACSSGSSMSARNSCARDTTARIAAAEAPKTAAAPPSLKSYSPFSDMTWGWGASNPLSGPTLAAEDFVVGSVMPYAALAPDAVPPSPAAVPRAAAPQEAKSPPIKPINAKVAALIASGKQAALKGDLDGAVRDFGEAIHIDPKYADSYLQRGQTYFKLGDTERAVADYSAALAHDPQHAAALRARGMAHLYSGKNDLALADLSTAIELAEHDPRLLAPIELFYARRSRGAIYDSKQQYDLEIADCTAIIESSAHDAVLAEALAANYGSAGTVNILARLYRQRANAFVRTSRAERAVADLTEAIRLSSDRGYAALLDRAKLHELLGRRDLAVADARAALNIRPGSEEAQLALSRLSALSNPARPNGL